MSRLRSICRAFRLRRRVKKFVEGASQSETSLSIAPQMRDSNLLRFNGAINNLQLITGQQNIQNVSSAACGNVVEVNHRGTDAACNIFQNAGQVSNSWVGRGFVAHDGDYLGTADGGWVFKAGQWVELSKAELSARRIASLRAQLAQAEAEAA